MLQAADPKTIAPRVTLVRVMVFWASFALMTIEIAAGRIMAPYLGVSLYTWTSVIGAVLLGVTVGNFVGGKLADRFHSKRVLSLCFFLSAIAALLIPPVASWIGPWFIVSALPAWASALLFCTLIFFPCAFLLSLVSPQAILHELKNLEQVGATVGGFGAWSAVGSILGTFIAGFLLIQYVATSHVLGAVSATLFLSALFILISRSNAYGTSRA